MTRQTRRRSIATITVVALSIFLPQPAGSVAQPAASATAMPIEPSVARPFAKAKTGTLKVTITGLPKNAKAKVVVNGGGKQRKLTKSTTLKKLKVFTYDITVSDLKYGKWWYRGISQSTVAQVRAGKTTTVKIRYKKASSPTPTQPPSNPAVRFSLDSSVAIGIAKTAARTTNRFHAAADSIQTNLMAVKSDNSVVPGLSSGTLDVSQTRVGPDGSAYLALGAPTTLDGDSQTCSLVRVRPGDTHGDCVDYSIESVGTMQGIEAGGMLPGNPTMQFDAAGSIYYLATPKPEPGEFRPQAIFRNRGGEINNLTPAGVSPADFLVTADGTVLASGSTNISQWVRKISPTGSVSNLTTQIPGFMRAFSDGNVYFNRTSYNDVARYLPTTGALDPEDWIGPCGISSPRGAHYWCEDIKDSVGGWSAFENVALIGPKVLVNLDNGQAIAPLNNYSTADSPNQGWILRFYPDPAPFRTTVTWPSTAVAAGNDLIVAGAASSGGKRLIAFNSETQTERTLLDGQVTITHLIYSAETSSVRFAGTRDSDGATVVGSVNLSTGQVSITPSSVDLLEMEGT